jgi:hypothetical protein
MSAVEMAVKKVKTLPVSEVRDLLSWLNSRQAGGRSRKKVSGAVRRKPTAQRSMRRLKAWQNSVRFTTDWEPPRMPDDMVRTTRL